MRTDDRTAILIIALFYVGALAALAFSSLADQQWAMLLGFLLAAFGAIFHIAESLFTRE